MKNMKLRYYLRGLGIGILVTAFILGVAKKEDASMTDAQIKERAYELGMVDSNTLVLSDLRNENRETSEQDTADMMSETEEYLEEADITQNTEEHLEEADMIQNQNTEEALELDADNESETKEDSIEDNSEETENMAVTKEDAVEEQSGVTESDTVISDQVISEDTYIKNGIAYFKIVSGEGSYNVSKVLEELKLIEEAETFDDYLCSNGHSTKIRTGNYAITVGTSEEEIIKIITGNR